jgi:hypothetical protein
MSVAENEKRLDKDMLTKRHAVIDRLITVSLFLRSAFHWAGLIEGPD